MLIFGEDSDDEADFEGYSEDEIARMRYAFDDDSGSEMDLPNLVHFRWIKHVKIFRTVHMHNVTVYNERSQVESGSILLGMGSHRHSKSRLSTHLWAS